MYQKLGQITIILVRVIRNGSKVIYRSSCKGASEEGNAGLNCEWTATYQAYRESEGRKYRNVYCTPPTLKTCDVYKLLDAFDQLTSGRGGDAESRELALCGLTSARNSLSVLFFPATPVNVHVHTRFIRLYRKLSIGTTVCNKPA